VEHLEVVCEIFSPYQTGGGRVGVELIGRGCRSTGGVYYYFTNPLEYWPMAIDVPWKWKPSQSSITQFFMFKIKENHDPVPFEITTITVTISILFWKK
jgi:hypothetical protein